MALCQRFLQSGVGLKAIVAITGLMLTGFTLMHLSGHMLLYVGPDALNAYAEKLKSMGALLWVARLGLLATFLVHFSFALMLNFQNKLARPVGYACQTTMKASFASRYMVHSGVMILLFVIYHLAHFTFRIAHPETNAVDAHNVYGMMVAGFSSPVISAFYILAMAALALHLRHGVASAFQSLGIFHPNINCAISQAALLVAVIVFVGYSSIPLAVMLGFIK